MRWRRLVEYFTTEYSRQTKVRLDIFKRTTAVESSPARVHDLARMSCKSRRTETSWLPSEVFGCEQEFAGPLRGLPGPEVVLPKEILTAPDAARYPSSPTLW